MFILSQLDSCLLLIFLLVLFFVLFPALLILAVSIFFTIFFTILFVVFFLDTLCSILQYIRIIFFSEALESDHTYKLTVHIPMTFLGTHWLVPLWKHCMLDVFIVLTSDLLGFRVSLDQEFKEYTDYSLSSSYSVAVVEAVWGTAILSHKVFSANWDAKNVTSDIQQL